MQHEVSGFERHGSGQAAVAVFTFGSFVNPNRTAPSYAFMKTCLDLRKTRGGDFDAYYFLANGNDWYLSGINNLGNGLAEAGKALDGLRRRHARALFIGNSMGGFAALRFGYRIGADRIIAFSPQVRLDAHFRAQHNDRRWEDAIAKLQNAVPAEQLTLESDVAGAPAGALTRADVYAGAECPQDIAQAHCLQRFPSVTVHAIPGTDHDLVHSFRETGQLKTILNDAISGLQER